MVHSNKMVYANLVTINVKNVPETHKIVINVLTQQDFHLHANVKLDTSMLVKKHARNAHLNARLVTLTDALFVLKEELTHQNAHALQELLKITENVSHVVLNA